MTCKITQSWFQAILAGAFANNDYEKATETASRVLQVLKNVKRNRVSFFKTLNCECDR